MASINSCPHRAAELAQLSITTQQCVHRCQRLPVQLTPLQLLHLDKTSAWLRRGGVLQMSLVQLTSATSSKGGPLSNKAQEYTGSRDKNGRWWARGTVSAIRNLYSNCCSRRYKITKLGKYCKDVPVYIAMESVFKLLLITKHQAYQPVRNVHQATGLHRMTFIQSLEEETCSGWVVEGKRTSWILRATTTGFIYYKPCTTY